MFLTCGKDDLLFSTDSGQTGTNFVSKGMYQAMPVRTVNSVPRADFRFICKYNYC